MNDQLSLALAYLNKLPPAIANSGGDRATFQAAIACRRFALSQSEMWSAMTWYNDNRCQPRWSDKELRHKMSGAVDMQVQKPLGGQRRQRMRAFVAPEPVKKLATDTRPIYLRSAQEEELWWAQRAIEQGTTLEEFDRRCVNA